MKTFRINDKYQIVCEYVKTRNGFKHVANLYRTGLSGTTTNISETKVCYLNRTWESYEYETVIQKLLEMNKDIFPKQTITKFLNRTSGKVKKEFQANCKSISMIAQIGNIFCNDQKEKNDWKKRMLLAGLPGLQIPEDWDILSENEKETRLNNVITELQK